ncbi:MAG: FAD-dependent thymidylate synthase [Clostridiales bacterium]|jgi:thymidylate synthase (FAD)|nr:FAD-dependent thymidylate synthase [Clostridiales bacterium]
MKVIEPSIEIISEINGTNILKAIEKAGRTCYKSEGNITDASAPAFVRRLIEREHESMLEHAPAISIKFICDRGVSHEIVRHRLFSFAQESTRYCNYAQDKFNNEITFIKPCFWEEREPAYNAWLNLMEAAERVYFELLNTHNASPERARSVLPVSVKTELVITGNAREWRHFFKRRTDKAAHPQMRQVANMALEALRKRIEILFDDI